VITYILAQPQSLPQLHSFLSFIGQFLPVFLQFGLSAAKVVVHIIATRMDIRIFTEDFIALALSRISPHTSKMFQK
jgi:hypothetical protein